LFWLASAFALSVVEDLVVTAYLRSANAFTNSKIVVVHHVWAGIWYALIYTINSIPDLTFCACWGIWFRILAIARNSIKEFAFFTFYFFEGAGISNERPVLSVPIAISVYESRSRNTVSVSSCLVDIPEIADSAILWSLLA
jgi:hypothetical protein